MKRAWLILMILLIGTSLIGCKPMEKTNDVTPESIETKESGKKTAGADGKQTKAIEQDIKIPGVIGTQSVTSEVSAKVQKHVKEEYQHRRDSLAEIIKKEGTSDKDPLAIQEKKNLDELEKLAYKAYTTCAAPFYSEERIKYGDAPQKIRRQYFDINLGRRVEESVNGKLDSVTVLDLKSDINYTYNAKKDRLEKVTNASKRGYGIYSFDIDCFDGNRNNANNAKSVVEKVDYNGIPAVKFSFKEKISISNGKEEFYNAVWFDAERGVLLSELQERSDGRFESTFDVKSNLKFDPAVFTFDQKKPSVKDMMVK